MQLSSLARLLDHQALSETWTKIAEILKPNLEKFWDPTAELYFDNLSAQDMFPQDGNSLACWFNIADKKRAASITKSLKKRWGKYGPVNPECSGPVSPFISGFELQALIRADKIHDALDMIRTTWGWMLNNPESTGSTMLEAWGSDGSITYPFYEEKPSYISHCHPFSTGPLLVLTFEVLGLNFAGDEGEKGGKRWEFRPSVGDIDSCEGGFTGKYGLYSAGWSKFRRNGKMKFDCWVDAPEGTVGELRLPIFGNEPPPLLSIDGNQSKYNVIEGYAWVQNVKGGQRHRFQI